MAKKSTSQSSPKKAVKKTVTAKKAAAPKSTPAPAAVKKTAAKKAAVKKPVAKKAAAKKTAVKKPAAKKTSVVKQTAIVARVDVGFGNELFVRGEGGGLSWNKGVLMECINDDEWTFSTEKAKTGIVFKFCLNDEVWSEGENLSVPAGGTSISSPSFA